MSKKRMAVILPTLTVLLGSQSVAAATTCQDLDRESGGTLTKPSLEAGAGWLQQPLKRWPLVAAHDAAGGYPIIGILGKYLLKSVIETQKHPIVNFEKPGEKDLLSRGVRSFDMRPYCKGEGDSAVLRFHHGGFQFDAPLTEVFGKTEDWSKEESNRNELIVMLISHAKIKSDTCNALFGRAFNEVAGEKRKRKMFWCPQDEQKEDEKTRKRLTETYQLEEGSLIELNVHTDTVGEMLEKQHEGSLGDMDHNVLYLDESCVQGNYLQSIGRSLDEYTQYFHTLTDVVKAEKMESQETAEEQEEQEELGSSPVHSDSCCCCCCWFCGGLQGTRNRLRKSSAGLDVESTHSQPLSSDNKNLNYTKMRMPVYKKTKHWYGKSTALAVPEKRLNKLVKISGHSQSKVSLFGTSLNPLKYAGEFQDKVLELLKSSSEKYSPHNGLPMYQPDLVNAWSIVTVDDAGRELPALEGEAEEKGRFIADVMTAKMMPTADQLRLLQSLRFSVNRSDE